MSCVHMHIDFTAQQVSKYQSCSTSMTSRQAPRKQLMPTFISEENRRIIDK